jgi:hypothetical protein
MAVKGCDKLLLEIRSENKAIEGYNIVAIENVVEALNEHQTNGRAGISRGTWTRGIS